MHSQLEVTEMLEPTFQRNTLLHRSCGLYAWKWRLNLSTVGQLNPGVWVLGFLITMPRKEARWWWLWTWTRTYSPQQQALVLLSVPIDNINIDVGVVINDYHCHLRGEGGRVFIKELHDSHVGRACNDCNGSTIGMYHEQKTSAWQYCSEDTYSTHHERKPRLHDGIVTVDRQVQVGRNSS